jgi:hypothetical protein
LISKPQPTPLLTPPRFSPPLLPSLSNNVTYYKKKKREGEKRETSGARMTAVRLCVSSSSASHEIRLIIRLYTHPIFWGGMRSAALVFYVCIRRSYLFPRK